MAPQVRTCPKLLGEALFGPDHPERGIQQGLLRDPVILAGLAAAAVLSPVGRELAAQEVARAVSGLLAIDYVDVLLGGWKRQRDLKAAARRTLADPDDRELVRLGAHCIEMHERPTVEVMVDGVSTTTLPIDIAMTALIDAMVARVESGMMTEIESGTITFNATVKVRQVTIGQCSCVLDAAIDIPLHAGIPLLTTTRVAPDRGSPAVSTCD